VTGNRLANTLFGDWEGSKDVRVLSGGVDLPPEERPLHKAASTGLPALRREFEVVAAEGKPVGVLCNAVPLLNGEGQVRGAVSIWADVTSLKEAEAEVRHLNADLERRVERRTEELRRALNELTSYAYSIAHDLRAPLRAVAGLTQLLVDESRDRLLPTSADYAGRIVAAARRMDEMILDLLEYSRISRDVYPVQEVDPYETCNDAIHKLTEDLHQRSSEVIVDGPMTTILGHQSLLREVFVQLLSNAAKFVRAGDTPKIRVRAESKGKAVRIWVEDNGIGIALEYREKIFGVFQRLHQGEDYPGTGMGLAIVRRAIERMEGRCGVESELGSGSRFWIELPKAAQSVREGTPSVANSSYLKF
jgi:signal transduction histidine kinase